MPAEEPTSVTVYRYGGRRAADGTLADLPPAAMEQLRLAHQFRNVLLDIEAAYDEEIRQAWAAHPTVGAALTVEAQAQAAVDELYQRARDERKTDRTTRPRPDTAAALKDAKAALKAAQNARREAQSAAYPVVNRTSIAPAAKTREAAITAARQEYSANGLYWGTYNDVLGHHKTAVAQIAAARKKGQPAALRRRRFDGSGTLTVQPQRGHGPDCRCPTCVVKLIKPWRVDKVGSRLTLTYREEPRGVIADLATAVRTVAWDVRVPPAALGAVPRVSERKGDESWRIDLINTAALVGLPGPVDPARTPELLASGAGKYANMFQVGPWVDPEDFDAQSRAARRKTGRGEALLQVRSVERGQRVGADQQITIPVQVHRMLPADADVALARVTRRRVGSGHTLALSVTAAVPPTPRRAEGPAIAVHVGWRVRDDKSLRVATWVATDYPAMSPNVADVVVDHGGWGEIILPERWRRDHDQLAALAAGRAKDLDRIKERLAAWLDEHGPVDVPGYDEPLTAGMVRLWRRPGRIWRLADAWRDRDQWSSNAAAVEVGAGELADDLYAWRGQDKHNWDRHAHRTAALEDRRDDAWRRVAAWLGRSARLVVVDDLNIRDLTRVPTAGDEDDVQAQKARANRQVAAPGRLRQLITVGAPRHGARLTVAPAKDGTAIHYWCGEKITPAEGFEANTEVWCDAPSCQRPVDQDRNMARMLLAVTGQVPPPGTNTTRRPT